MDKEEWVTGRTFKKNHLIGGLYSRCGVAPWGVIWLPEDKKKPYCKTCKKIKEGEDDN